MNWLYFSEVEALLIERIGTDLGWLLLSFVKEDPKPHYWVVEDPTPSPWDPLVEVDPMAGVDLPLFAP
jgi:hypothetical protein